MKKLIPADTVDSNGNVWETIGENIRHGEKEFSESELKAIVDILFPIGSIFCGENSFILSVGKWSAITSPGWDLIYTGGSYASGTIYSDAPEYARTGNTTTAISLRMWRRVS